MDQQNQQEIQNGENPEQSEQIAPFPKLDYAFFSEEQKHYLEILTKYSSRKTKVQVVGSGDLPLRKETFVKDNLSYLTVDEQVSYNDNKLRLVSAQQYAMYIGLFGFCCAFTYYMIVTPLTRSLLKESMKGLGFGFLSGYSYYKYKEIEYREKLHNYYVLVLDRVLDRRRKLMKD